MEEMTKSLSTIITISVVSHGQIALIYELMQDIQRYCTESDVELLLTLNLHESIPFNVSAFSYPVKVIHNISPKGFGANHNQAFLQRHGRYFCVVNPDIRFSTNPFPDLLSILKISGVGVVGPLVHGITGELEDSVRRFPTPSIILSKALGTHQHADYFLSEPCVHPDWIGGMFMVFSADIFCQLEGFDERYFLYYEDVDLCARLTLAGYRVAVSTSSHVVHHAQRTSHRSFKFLRWHIASMLRFFLSPVNAKLRKLSA